MKIIACIKQVPDPETPSTEYRIDQEAKRIVLPKDVPLVISPFDANAVEAGIQLKEEIEGTLTVISLATTPTPEIIRDLRHTLAMGADQAILLDDPAFKGGDSHSTAYSLAMAIKTLGEYDLILCGRQAADTNAGQTGMGISEFLGLPCVTVARKIDITGNTATVERVINNGYETVEVALPTVITVSNELGQARYPSIKNIAKSNSIKPVIWQPSDIGLKPEACGMLARRIRTASLYLPVFEATCEVVVGETIQEAAQNLAVRLRLERIL